ncbi:MAG TPA: hypothetical protein DCG12_05520 [Planctomycetaceae bacterium]|nr:hypothetical protein [Planctomycetaceae bacterium]
MPIALITPASFVNQPGEQVDVLTNAGFEVIFPDDPSFTTGRPAAETIAQLSRCDAVLAGGEICNSEVLRALPNLKVIARAGVGYDRIDISAATENGTVVTITPTANHESVAEHAMMLLLAVAKQVLVNDPAVRRGDWPHKQTIPVRGTTVGIVGLGRIGRSFARRVAAFGVRIVATETHPDEDFVQELGIEIVQLSELLSRSDFVSLHCPLTDQTNSLINSDTLSRMKPRSILINTARGGLVDETALEAALASGQLRGAGLDCLRKEPAAAGHPLFRFENVVFTPHIASADWKSQHDMAVEAAQCIAQLYQGEWPEAAIVNRELKGWRWDD